MNLISTHVCMTKDVGVHGNLFGGVMLAWLDEAGAAFSSEACGTPRMVAGKISEVTIQKPERTGQKNKIYCKIIKFGNTSVTFRLDARRHSPYNGSQKTVCTTDMTFVRIEGDGESVPIDELVKSRFEEQE